MRHYPLAPSLIAALATAMLGCAHQRATASQDRPVTATSGAQGTMAAGADGLGVTEAQPDEPPVPPPAPGQVAALDDAGLAGVVQAIHRGALATAELGIQRSSSPVVRQFAERVRTLHRDEEVDGQTLATRLALVPTESLVSQHFFDDLKNEQAALTSARGDAFDAAFVDDQVQDLHRALTLLDQVVEGARAPQLAAEASRERVPIDRTLAEAERLQRALRTAVMSVPAPR